MERRIDIKDIKDQLPEFSDQMAVLTLRLQTWVAGCVEILSSRERKMSWFGIEDNEFLLGHGEFEELRGHQGRFTRRMGMWSGAQGRELALVVPGASRGHRQRVKLWEYANHPRRVGEVGRGKSYLRVSIIFCENFQNIFLNPLGASELQPVRSSSFQSKYGNSREKQLEKNSSTERGV